MSTPLAPLDARLAGRHLVVTGTTGFVGKVWLALVLTHLPSIGRITLLVRPGKDGDAVGRVARMIDTSPAFRPLRERWGSGLAGYLAPRLEVLAADLDAPNAGLDRSTRDRLAETADLVLHIAGTTDFQPDPLEVMATNIDGALNMADLASHLATPRLVHVSTTYVVGNRPGRHHTPEAVAGGVAPNGERFDPQAQIAALRSLVADMPDARTRIRAGGAWVKERGWPNLYTWSKAMAEELLARRDDVSVSIARPSIVESAESFPMKGWNEGMNTSAPLVWYMTTPFPGVPVRAEAHFDIVPVDAVAGWLTAVVGAAIRDEAAPVYQLAASDTNPLDFERVVDLNSLAIRRHRRSGDSLLARLSRDLETVVVRHEAQGFFSPRRLRSLAFGTSQVLQALEAPSWLPGPVAELVDGARVDAAKGLGKTGKALTKVVRMLDAFRPFTCDNDWVFETAATRAEVERLHPDDRALFGRRTSEIDWRTYWLEVHYPGLERWSLPLLRGETIPDDPPSSPPLSLQAALPARRTA